MSDRVVRNAARCRKCDTVVESHHRHDWVPCKCGAIFVDGGLDYLRWGGEPGHFESLAIIGCDEIARVSEGAGLYADDVTETRLRRDWHE